jgi:signal transduction histidine kinase/CheY-like chemotaxis protein
MSRSYTEITHPECLEDDRRRVAEILVGRDGATSWEKRYVHRSGAIVWAEVTPHLLRDAQGAPRYFITAVQDITARRALEDQLRQSQKLEAVGQLAGGVAHDFNNLLTVIEGHAALAERALPAGHPARADLEHVGAATRRAAELTRHLLAFARREIIEPRVLHPRSLVEESQQMLRRLIGERIGFEVDVPATLPWIRIDRGQFEQVLVNLVVNARDAMPQGGRIAIGASEVTVPEEAGDRFPGAAAGRHVEFRVSDSGTGIAAQVQPHIFEPFFTTKQPGQGTGLGLSTCFGIVRQAGGQMWFESAEGSGTTFHVLLPAVPAPQPELAPETVPAAKGAGREVILLVEDEPAIRTIAERGLSGLGYRVHSAADGAEATVRAEELGDTVDLLVTDVIMPGILGRDLAERLVARFPRMKVLYVSGYGRDNLEGQLAEGTHFLAKPFGPGELAEKVRAVLDGTD